MVRTVATPGVKWEEKTYRRRKKCLYRGKRGKSQKTREPNLVFPRTGKAWVQEDIDLIHSIIDDIPDESIDDHILWLSKQQGRTPYAIALKIVSEGRMNKEWAKKVWKPAAKSIREDFSRLQTNMPDNKETDE